LLADLDLFVENEAGLPGRTPVALEVAFGRPDEGGDPETLSQPDPVVVRVGRLTFRIAGRVDRIDRLDDGTFEILDYKTGTYWPDRWKGTFAGGRRLQHALYGLAAIELLKRAAKKPRITGAQYYFSSAKGRLERKTIPTQPSQALGSVLESLHEVVTQGLFLHTPSEEDCRFCDYSPACGAGAHERAREKRTDALLAAYQRLAGHE
jgi:ATP-dependent helicase/nuclease subunit B